MKYLKKTDQYFWFFLILSIGLGLTFPSFISQFQGIIIYLIMIIMGLLFLKVDIVDVVTHIKNPGNILYVILIKLIFLPTLVFFIFKDFDPNLQMGLFLLAALPTGVSSAVFTDIMKGRTSLSLTLVILSNLISIFTIPLLFYIFYNAELNVDVIGLFTNLLKITLFPFLIAKVIKRVVMPNIVNNLQSYLNLKIILLLSCMIMICISFQAKLLLASFSIHIKTIGILFACFLGFQLIGYFSVFWKNKGEKLACSNCCMIMNNVLGIVLTIAAFDPSIMPDILNVVVLSLIPWNFMIIAKHWYKRFLP